MGEEKPEGMNSIRQKVNMAGDSSIIRKTGDLTLDFVEQGVDRNQNTDHLTNVAGPQQPEQAGAYFRATTARKHYKSTDADEASIIAGPYFFNNMVTLTRKENTVVTIGFPQKVPIDQLVS